MKSVHNHPLIWSIVAGILLGLSFSPFNALILLFPAFAILLYLAQSTPSFKRAMYLTFPGVVTWNIVATYWLMFATIAGGIAAILANAVIMTVPLAIGGFFIRKRWNPVFIAILVAASWVGYEFLHFRWDLAWPWLITGNALANYHYLIQYVSITGVLGVSFWVLSCATLMVILVKEHENGKFSTSVSLITTVWLLALPILSLWMYYSIDFESDTSIEVIVVQPNYDSYLPNAGYPDVDTPLREIIAITNSVVTPNTSFVFWPENALQPNVHGTSSRYPSDRLLVAAERWNTVIVTGATWYNYYYSQNPPPYSRYTASGEPYNIFNSALAYHPDGRVEPYEKANLVPIVERLPFYGVLSLIPGINWQRWMGYGKGSQIVNFSNGEISSPAMICYDSVFPDWVRRHVLQGADFIAVITNDGWWGDTSGHTQHFDFAKIRAIETHRTVIRSANNGISGMILANGRAVERTEYWTQATLNLDVPIHTNLTFYARYGDWIGWLSLIIVVSGFLVVLSQRRIKSNGLTQ
jgi:apolipoprotein N-acyltransferase